MSVNASEPTLCAEKDNVYLKLQSAEARRFTVEAAHPAYVGTIVKRPLGARLHPLRHVERSGVQIREAPR